MQNKTIAGILLVIFGAGLVIIGPVTNKIIDKIKEDKIDDKVVIEKFEDDGFVGWKSDGDESDPIYYRSFNFFNITNVEEARRGAVPIVQEVGPYPFRRIRDKINIVYSDDGKIVSYINYEHYHFLEDQAEGRKMTDLITSANAAYLTILTRTQGEQGLGVAVFASFLPSTLNSIQGGFINKTYVPNSVPQTILAFASTNQSAFVDQWRKGDNTPINPYPIQSWALASDLSSELSLETSAALFDPSRMYSLTSPSTFNIWQGAAFNSSQATFLQSFWGISAEAQRTISQWALNWRLNNHPLLLLGNFQAYNVTSVNDLAYLQWATLAPSSNASLAILDPSVPFYIEFAGWARYVQGVPATLTVAQAKTIFSPAVGLANTTKLVSFLTRLRTGGTDYSDLGLSPTEAQLVGGYYQYVVNQTVGNAILAGGGLYTTHNVRDFIFNYTDPLLKIINPASPYSVVIRNFTSVEDAQAANLVESVYTGEGNLDDLARYRLWESANNVSFWAEPEFFDGTEGLRRRPRLNKEDYHIFSDTLRRNVILTYRKTVKVKGIKLQEYRIRPDQLYNVTKNPANSQYYFEIDGYLNFTQRLTNGVKGVPIFLSKPHMLDCDPTWSSRVRLLVGGQVINGMQPNIDLHDTFVRSEHQSGATMDAAKRVQLNVQLNPALFGVYTNVSQTMFLPVYWGDERSTLTDDQAHDFKDSVYKADNAGTIIMAVLVPIGGILLIVGIILLVLAVLQRNK